MIFAVVVVLAAGAGAAAHWFQAKSAQEDAGTPTPTLSEDANDLQNLRSEGNEEEFNKKLFEALANESLDSKSRYQVLLQQGHAHRDKEEYPQAIESYLQAEQVEATFEVTELLADTYHLAGDTAKAIEYYRKAIELIPPDRPTAEATKDLFENIIKELEG